MASELRMAECRGEELRSEFNEGRDRKGDWRLERGRGVKGQTVGYEVWESVVDEGNRGEFEVLEGWIRRLMKRIEELENDRKE